ncbi:MAG: transporter substrate-binding domain-containing protein [Pseudomonadota bacterium]
MQFRRYARAVVAGSFAIVACVSHSFATEIRIATGDYAPFTDSAEPTGGVVNAFVSKIVTRAGLSGTFEFNPWMRSLELTRAGRFDATSFWYFSPEREADFIHVGPVMRDRLVFFRRADTPEPKWDGLNDLKGHTIGAVTGYTYTPEFWELAEEGTLNVELAPSDEANFKKLLAGRIDLFPMSEESGRRLVSTIFSTDEQGRIVYSAQPLVVTDGYLLVSRAVDNAEELAKRLQSAADALTEATD